MAHEKPQSTIGSQRENMSQADLNGGVEDNNLSSQPLTLNPFDNHKHLLFDALPTVPCLKRTKVMSFLASHKTQRTVFTIFPCWNFSLFFSSY